MMTYIVPVDFIISRDEAGNKKYSYGTTVYDTPERWLGGDCVRGAYSVSPKESFDIIIEKLSKELQIEKRLADTILR